MPKQYKILRILPWIIGVSIVGWFYRNHSMLSLDNVFTYPLELLLIVFAIYLVYLVLSILSNIILFANWNHRVSFWKLTLINMAAGTSNYLGPMHLNIPLRIYMQKKLLGLPYNISSSCKLALLFIDTTIVAAISSAYLLRVTGSLHYLILTLVAIVVIIAAFLSLHRLKLSTRYNLLNRTINFAVSTINNIRQIRFPYLILIIVLAVIKRLLSSLSTYIIIMFFAPDISFLDILVIHSLATFLGIISFMPMGLGVKDISFIEMLKLEGVAPDISLSIVIIERFIWTLIPLLIGLICMFYVTHRYDIKEIGPDDEM